MGRRGPPRTPTSMLKLRGSWRAGRRGDEPKPPVACPPCPSWLRPEAKKAWRSHSKQLAAARILTKLDIEALARYCQLLAKLREAEAAIAQGAYYVERDADGKIKAIHEIPQVARALAYSDALLRLEREFGLTPAARANLSVPAEPVEGGLASFREGALARFR